jgi:ribonucleotide reductase beta subunit family protein with ferritin-like domain
MDVYWLPTEIAVEKDVQDLRANMTPAESHGVVTVLKLFTLYELIVGNEYWGEKIKKAFPRPDIEFMATTFGFVEIGIHARFYNRVNEAMMLDTEEFYDSYKNDPVLAERIEFVNSVADDTSNLPLAVAAFSMLEGAVLYSSFAFLKHFQSEGKNKLVNVCRGINFSVRDENLHATAGAWLFNTLVEEMQMTETEREALDIDIQAVAHKIASHEDRIIDMIFEKGEIEGIDAEELRIFVRSRINLCLRNLGVEEVFEIGENPISEWFYNGINSYQLHDFFTGVGSEYNRAGADEDSFEW